MAILFAGGEDFDFPLGTAPVDTTAGRFRSGYARCGLGGVTGTSTPWQANSQSFSAVPVTSLWFTARIWNTGFTSSGTYYPLIGVMNSGVPGKGLWIAAGNNAAKVQLQKIDGTTTVLGTDPGTSLSTGTVHKLDVSIQNYGASSTITVYVDQNPIITYNGSSSITGVSGFDQIGMQIPSGSSSQNYTFSEVAVATEDTRSMVVVALTPNALGTTDQWTGALADINETTLSDATVNVTNTVAQDQMFALADLPTGNFAVRAVVMSARATSPAGSTATQLSLGVRSGSITDVAPGVAPGTGFLTVQRIMDMDPTTGLQWTTTSVNAVQLAMRSA